MCQTYKAILKEAERQGIDISNTPRMCMYFGTSCGGNRTNRDCAQVDMTFNPPYPLNIDPNAFVRRGSAAGEKRVEEFVDRLETTLSLIAQARL